MVRVQSHVQQQQQTRQLQGKEIQFAGRIEAHIDGVKLYEDPELQVRDLYAQYRIYLPRDRKKHVLWFPLKIWPLQRTKQSLNEKQRVNRTHSKTKTRSLETARKSITTLETSLWFKCCTGSKRISSSGSMSCRATRAKYVLKAAYSANGLIRCRPRRRALVVLNQSVKKKAIWHLLLSSISALSAMQSLDSRATITVSYSPATPQ